MEGIHEARARNLHSLEVRYTRGFTDVRKGTESMTGAFTATVGIEFRN
jgi:hypothetical protein